MEKKMILTFDDYIATAPQESRGKLLEIRKCLKALIPNGEEVISYGMPAFSLNGIVVWYAGYKNHIGFYPKSAVIELLKEELQGYKTSKGAIQLPLDRDLPYALIEEIVRLRILANNEKADLKLKAKKSR